MDIRQILDELARVQLEKDSIMEALKSPLEIRNDTCPKCRKAAFLNARLWTPMLDDAALEIIAPARHAHVIRLFQILDGYCGSCGFDWWRSLCRIDPDGREPALVGIPPKTRYNQLCAECLELGIRGTFRGSFCTGGYCVTCHIAVATTMISTEFRKRREHLLHAIAVFENRTSLLIQLAETYGEAGDED